MKIAFLNTNRESFPLPRNIINGGLWVTGTLITALADNPAFQIFYFATEDTVVPSQVTKVTLGLDSFYKRLGNRDLAPHEAGQALFYEQCLIAHAIDMAQEHTFDLIHIHSNFLYISNFFEFFKIPIVYTLHDPISEAHKFFFQHKELSQFHTVAVSNFQKQRALEANIPVAATIYNGIDSADIPYNETGAESLLFSGRVVLKKGIEEAIKAAKSTHHHLDIVGSYREYDKDALQHLVLEQIDNQTISWIKPQSRLDVLQEYSKHKVTLAPILWEEPFGLIAIESLAAGTPLIGYARGAFPEVIQDGVTGYLVNPSDSDKRGNFQIQKTGFAGLLEAIERLYNLSEADYRHMRSACRQQVEQRFSSKQMAQQYAELYQKL